MATPPFGTSVHEKDTLPPTAEEVAEAYSNLNQHAMVAVYTTAYPVNDLPETVTDRIVEQVSSQVQVRCVMVPAFAVDAQIAAYKLVGCLAATEAEWQVIQQHRGK